ncbi:unnamed protein product [Didymodactylos carnosus]|uniref:Uncharacterized protein n=2 Tax=Didymodactylos carnosus TaxID=1234261 RepID=A0A815USE8_9BILA|nr:unnamed protein product [Didymodactylos carnosus]CAF4380744.1 unnamed protein product [Didymodactylos carnosus]
MAVSCLRGSVLLQHFELLFSTMVLRFQENGVDHTSVTLLGINVDLGYEHECYQSKIPSVDIWSCAEEHNMDSTHFFSWLDSTCATLREEIGEKKRIAICLDNATWHNKLTEESIIPKRSSTKGEIQKWLRDRKIQFPEKFVKAQLLQLFVRDQNTTFRQDDVKQLIEQFMDDKLASSYFHHVYKVEEMYKTADEIMEEEIEPHLQSDNEETGSDDDEENVEQ